MYLEHEEAKRAHTKKGRMVAKEGKEVRGMRAEDKEEDVKNGEKSRRRRERMKIKTICQVQFQSNR